MDLGFVLQWLGGWSELNLASATALGLIFVIAAFLPFPRTLLLITAGVVFGIQALMVIIPGATLGSVLSFLLARYLLRDWFTRMSHKNAKLNFVAAAVDAEGWRVVAIMRLGVPVPSAVQNYLFAMTRINLLPFTLATLLFSIPQSALFVHLGSAGRTALSLQQDSIFNQVYWALGCVMTVTLIVLIGRHARRQLNRVSEAL